MNLKIYIFYCLVLFSGFKSQAADDKKTWADRSSSDIKGFDTRSMIPAKYRTFSMDIIQLRKQLLNAPDENLIQNRNTSTCILLLPMPDGSEKSFRVTESPVMEKGLADAFPLIKTYSAVQTDDPLTIARLDVTELGFHGMIMSPTGWSLIEPVLIGNTTDYLCYYRKDSRNKQDFICGTAGDDDQLTKKITGLNQGAKSNGTQLRTYRLALACTGEYAAVFGGTVSAALSAMVTSVNRVTGVYETEVAVRMVLIANDNLLIYTNASTDPYTNSNGSTMLTENQNNITSVIGTANYDIGHVFSTGGGGIAQLGCVCSSASKSKGVTGSGAPYGDGFDIDYVAHEMGHQFNGNHTFNSVLGSCGGGNRNASTAYETGSGITIMAYAGICSTDDLAPHSIAYFHTKSFEEIVNFTNTGTGNSCAVATNTGNTAPIVNAGADYSIPISTPFTLTGSATDADNDPLTYSWEEMDVTSNGGAWNQTQVANIDNPLFRPFDPVTIPSRTFPKISDIVNNTTIIGELLPIVARVLDFRLTARDNKSGGSGVAYNDVTQKVTVVATAGPFTVTVPNTAVIWTSGTTQTVTWNVANTTTSPVSCSNVKISLSNDGGFTYPTVILASTANDGSESITVPNVITTQARIKVEAVGNIFFDISNVNFTIQPSNPLLSNIITQSLASNNICVGTSVSVTYATDGPANSGNIFTAQLSNSSGTFASGVVNIGTLTSVNAGTITATIPLGTAPGTLYRIRVISSNPSINGSDNGSNISIFGIPADAGTITGINIVCQGQNSVAYAVPVIANATNYNWSIPTGATIATGANTSSITINFSASATSPLIFNVSGSNAGCSGTVSPNYSITVNTLPAAAGTITGTTSVCQGQSGLTYSVPLISGASGYNWTLPTGATITSPISNTITVSYSGSALPGIITVAGTNGCGSGVSSSLSIAVNVSPAAPVISSTGSTSVCSPSTVNLSLTPQANTLYQWRLNGADISSATGSSYIASISGNYDVLATGFTQNVYTNSTPATIIDNSCTAASSSIVVGGYGGTINPAGISVKINVTHTWDGDLVIFLLAPNGDIVGLSNRVGSSGQNFVNTVFADSGAAILPATGAPYTGLYKPWSSLFTSCITSTKTTFASIGAGAINPNGTWTLRVYDRATADIGTIDNWTLTLPKRNSTCTSSSNLINVSINQPVTVSVSIAASPSANVCPNTPVTYTATAINPGSGPVYQWTKNGIAIGSNNNIYVEPAPNNNDTIVCTLISNDNCVTGSPAVSNQLIMTVGNVPPAISGFSPSAGIPGTMININGANLNGTSIVKFNGVNAAFVIMSNTQIITYVPAGASTGLISVVNSCGTGNASLNFTVLPSIDLNLGMFIEGFYSNGVMLNTAGNAADTIQVLLYNVNNFTTPVAISIAILSTSGNAVVYLPSSISGTTNYIAVRHRSSLETWSKNPVLFSTTTNFSFKN